MICVHVKKLYQLCEQEGLKLSSADLIHIVCNECGVKEVCPSMLADEYDGDKQRQQTPDESVAHDPATKD